jgi:hypothetical protein
MPTIPSRARRWIGTGKATPFFSKGVFCVRLNADPSGTATQPIAVGIDPGSKWEGLTVKSAAHTYLNVHADAVTWVSKTVEQRRQMRRTRRYRKTPCRANRKNRSRGGLPPSTHARWQWKLRLIKWLVKIFPVTQFVVEDIKVRTRAGNGTEARHWNFNFSPLMVGKQWFYSELGKLAPVMLRTDTSELREHYGVAKTNKKSALIFASHCVDSWVLANAWTGGHAKPDNERLLYVTPLRWHRRRLHMLQPGHGGYRRPYGGTRSLGLKRGAIVRHPKYGVSYVGGTSNGRVSLHAIDTSRRLTQSARLTDCRVLSPYNSWRARLLPAVNDGVSGAREMR